MPQQQERTRVAIVGAGIVGLTLAIALNAFDKERKLKIDIYEATPALAEIGAGINAWPRTLEIFKQIGLEEALVPLFDHIPDLEYRLIFGIRKADQKNGFKIYDTMNNGGALRIHRADLQRTLISHLPLADSSVKEINSICNLHLSHRIVDYDDTAPSGSSRNSGPITIHFTDKPSTTCDILIGADGIKSSIRQMFLSRLPNPQKYTNCLEPKWSGLVAYRGLVAREELEKEHPGHNALTHSGLMYSGKGRYVVVYPVSNGKFINVVAIARESPKYTPWKGPWKKDVSQEEAFEKYKGWDEEVQALIRCIPKPTKWGLHALDHLDIYAKGRVFLMGDSAHAMLPHLGAGAHVGIEDAYIFASLLTHPSVPIMPSAQHMNDFATIFNTIRIPRAVAMSKSSEYSGHLLHHDAPEFEDFGLDDQVPDEVLLEMGRTMEKNWAWSTIYADEDRIRGFGLLEAPRAVL